MSSHKPNAVDLSEAAIQKRHHLGMVDRGRRFVKRHFLTMALPDLTQVLAHDLRDRQDMLFFAPQEADTSPRETDILALEQVRHALEVKSYHARTRPVVPTLAKLLSPEEMSDMVVVLGALADRPQDQAHLLRDLVDHNHLRAARDFMEHHPKSTAMFAEPTGDDTFLKMAEDYAALQTCIKSFKEQGGGRGHQRGLPCFKPSEVSSARATHNLMKLGCCRLTKKAQYRLQP